MEHQGRVVAWSKGYAQLTRRRKSGRPRVHHEPKEQIDMGRIGIENAQNAGECEAIQKSKGMNRNTPLGALPKAVSTSESGILTSRYLVLPSPLLPRKVRESAEI